MKGSILFVSDSLKVNDFFLRVSHAISGHYETTFLTTEPVAHCKNRIQGFASYYIRRPFLFGLGGGVSKIDDEDELIAERSIEYLNGRVSRESAYQDISLIVNVVEEMLGKGRFDKCVMWNGQQLLCLAAKIACFRRGVSCRFLEIANLPGKIFADDLGVNAASTLSMNPGLLDGYDDIDGEDHERWLREYEEIKKRPPPQALIKRREKFLNGANILAKKMTRGVVRKTVESIGRIRLKKSSRKEIGKLVSLESDYVFLPLQVSADTQLRLNSDIDNVGAIKNAKKLADERRVRLIVKVHPAENDISAIQDVRDLSKEIGFEISTNNTTDLLKSASLVVTINSTVGLEAMLYKKELVVLGRCFYKQFDQSRLRKYIHRYLISGVDYFSNEQISFAVALRILGFGKNA